MFHQDGERVLNAVKRCQVVEDVSSFTCVLAYLGFNMCIVFEAVAHFS